MSDNGTETKDIATVEQQSIQDRARPVPVDKIEQRGLGISLFSFLVQGGGLVSPWWSKQRDMDLYRFHMTSDHLAGAFYTLSAKLASVPFRIEPRDTSVSAHRKLAEEYQIRLQEESELGQAWQEVFTLFLLDLWTQDNGAFFEVTGDGAKDGPIVGPATGLLHLDSWRCTRTGDPEYPVVYQDVDGARYKLHRSRVIYRSQMPSARAEMLRVGFCWTSRAINAAQNLVDESVYKQEKLGSRPQRAMFITRGGLDPETLDTAFRAAESNISSMGLSRYSKFVIAGDANMPDADITQIDLASLPDGFDYETDVTIGMYTIALTGAVPPRWLWPATTTGATKADAMYQHVAGLTGGPGATLEMVATALGGSSTGRVHRAGKFLPPTLRMEFDFQDDEQDRMAAEIGDTRSQARERDLNTGVITLRVARENMLSDGEITEAQFEDMELEEGRLSDGSDVLTLFNSPDPFFRDVLALGVPDPLDVRSNDAEMVLAAAEQASLDCMAIAGNPTNAKERDQAKRALAALSALKDLYEGTDNEEEVDQPVADEASMDEGANEEIGIQDGTTAE